MNTDASEQVERPPRIVRVLNDACPGFAILHIFRLKETVGDWHAAAHQTLG
jgi:hypothetical protein